MLTDNLKKIEYRTDENGAEVIDFVYKDNTKKKVRTDDLQAEVDKLDEQKAALDRRRAVVVAAQGLVNDNRPIKEKEAVLEVEVQI